MFVSSFYKALITEKINFFCGVPDSLLKELCSYIDDNASVDHHIITANEGNAIALAAGHYLATKNPALVYMQNSGIGNAINPMLSLIDEDVYSIPMLMIIGWRGEPNTHDEPQHIKQGKVTLPLLETIGIKYEILENISQVSKATEYMRKTSKPFALIIKKGTFETYKSKKVIIDKYTMTREDAIKKILSLIDKEDIIVSSTGMISREVYENSIKHEQSFLTVGSMGHSSSIAMGIALEKSNRKVICLDGDGSFLMHMGAIAVIATKSLQNFKHIIFNNGAHDSVGGQENAAKNLNISNISKSCGYTHSYTVQTLEEIEKTWPNFYNKNGTNLLEIKINCGSRKDLGRPKEKPCENKVKFMNFINNNRK